MPEENISPEEILSPLLDQNEIHESILEAFSESFIFSGRSLKDHAERIRVVIPERSSSFTPEIFRDTHLKLSRSIQIAAHHYAISVSLVNAISSGNDQKKQELVATIIQNYETRNAKRPGINGINAVAQRQLADTMALETAAKISKDFWKIKLDSLIELRKTLEQIGISMHSEMKYLDHS